MHRASRRARRVRPLTPPRTSATLARVTRCGARGQRERGGLVALASCALALAAGCYTSTPVDARLDAGAASSDAASTDTPRLDAGRDAPIDADLDAPPHVPVCADRPDLVVVSIDDTRSALCSVNLDVAVLNRGGVPATDVVVTAGVAEVPFPGEVRLDGPLLPGETRVVALSLYTMGAYDGALAWAEVDAADAIVECTEADVRVLGPPQFCGF